MTTLIRTLWIGGALAAATWLVLAVVPGMTPTWAAEAAPAAVPEPAPPANQGYTGSKRCSSCHFQQYNTWKKTKHAEAFNNLPAKYKRGADAQCFGCHITGYGHPQGYTGAATADLLGVTCESCHGPGSEHERVSQQFKDVVKLTPQQEKLARDTIWMLQPGNICSTCHRLQSHKEHPEFEKEE